MEEEKLFNDDGSLGCLHIPVDRTRKRFNCPEEQQSNLVNQTFWVMDYFDNVHSRYGDDKYLFKIKFDKDADESTARKVWTGSDDIKYILDTLRDINKFPRRVTLRKEGKNHYFFE